MQILIIKANLFYCTVFAEGLLLSSIVIGILFPVFRIWPPPSKKSWQTAFFWVTMMITYGGFVILGWLDWNTFFFHSLLRFFPAIILISGGSAYAIWGVRTLSLSTAMGLGGAFQTKGPYRYHRNPQYIGTLLFIMGYFLLTNSLLVMITGFLSSLWLYLAVFSEEIWLLDMYGDEFKEYKKRIPRYIGFPRNLDYP